MAEEKQSRLKSTASSLGQQALGVGARRLLGQGLSRAGAALGSAFGPVGTAGGAALGRVASNKYVLGGAAAAFFVLILLPVIIFVAIFGFGGGEPVIAQEEEILSVTKSANPSQIDKNAPPTEITYEIVVKNVSTSTVVKNIKISDGSLGLEKTIGDLSPGTSYTETVKDTITNTSIDRIVTNKVVVTGIVPSTNQPAGGLSYYIPFRDNAVKVIDENQVKSQVANNPSWPNNFVFTQCGSGITCWDYAKKEASAAKVNPAFVLAVWIAESGASNSPGHLSCPNGGVGLSPTVKDFKNSVNCFLHGEKPTDPFKGASNYPATQFAQMLDDFCDPTTPEICQEPPNPPKTFLNSLKSWYSNLIPAGNYGELTQSLTNGGSGSPGEKSVTATTTASVIIGNPPQGPPTYSPLKGGVYLSGYDFMEYSPYQGSNHQGVDIATKGSDWNVYSPFVGMAEVKLSRAQTDEFGNLVGYGKYAILVSGQWTALFAHMDPVYVKQGDVVSTDTVIGVMDKTGLTSGDHVHYEVTEAGILVDPKNYNALTSHP